MRRVLKGAAFTVVSGGALGYYGMFTARQSSHAAPKYQGKELSADEWNALQDGAVVDQSFKSLKDLTAAGPALYWLYGCPYCARVRALLDFHKVPYSPVAVDPVNFEQLNAMPYKCCPQMQLIDVAYKPEYTSNPDFPITKFGPMVVDSEKIITRIAGAAKTDITALQEKRDWITHTMARLVFVSGGSSISRAYAVMPLVTPEKYHGFLFRLGGAIPMFLLSKYKTSQRIADQYAKSLEQDKVPAEVRLILGDTPFTVDKVDQVLQAELTAFMKEVKPFYGGKKPNFVDVELYGLLRSQQDHGPIVGAIKGAGALEWYGEMAKACPSSAITERLSH